jgi:hypothetical protein
MPIMSMALAPGAGRNAVAGTLRTEERICVRACMIVVLQCAAHCYRGPDEVEIQIWSLRDVP